MSAMDVLREIARAANGEQRNVQHAEFIDRLERGDRAMLNVRLQQLENNGHIGRGQENVNLTDTGLTIGNALLQDERQVAPAEPDVRPALPERWDEVLIELHDMARIRGDGVPDLNAELDTTTVPNMIGLNILPTYQQILAALIENGFIELDARHPEMCRLTAIGEAVGAGIIRGPRRERRRN